MHKIKESIKLNYNGFVRSNNNIFDRSNLDRDTTIYFFNFLTCICDFNLELATTIFDLYTICSLCVSLYTNNNNNNSKLNILYAGAAHTNNYIKVLERIRYVLRIKGGIKTKIDHTMIIRDGKNEAEHGCIVFDKEKKKKWNSIVNTIYKLILPINKRN
jgi:hypothetical protein